jgi:hypothetical protein
MSAGHGLVTPILARWVRVADTKLRCRHLFVSACDNTHIFLQKKLAHNNWPNNKKANEKFNGKIKQGLPHHKETAYIETSYKETKKYKKKRRTSKQRTLKKRY